MTCLKTEIISIISETNGIAIKDTLELLCYDPAIKKDKEKLLLVKDFLSLLNRFQGDQVKIERLLQHPVSNVFYDFFKLFPLKFYEEHIHLTGSLSPSFIFPRLKALLDGPNASVYEKKIIEVYGEKALPIESVKDIENLVSLKENEEFTDYLRILYLAKLILKSKADYEEAAYHLATELYTKFNIGSIRLKFSLSRITQDSSEQIPGIESLSEKDVVLGLYEGFAKFKQENSDFSFFLSPCFRKENSFYDAVKFKTKKDYVLNQVNVLLDIIEQHPYLKNYLSEIDTVGDERHLYRKTHFLEMKTGFRKLQYNGFKIRSHHGETWLNLRKGVQSVDNAMNIWHIDTLEHGLSLGINPNFYFQRLFQRVCDINEQGKPITVDSPEYYEIMDMEWYDTKVRDKLLSGTILEQEDKVSFVKTKFHTAREVEHYQHDVLNRMINKKVSLVALPTSNMKLTSSFPDFKHHPFSWWEKKGVQLGVGTDNYITLGTDYIKEILILLYSDPDNLKITKLLMITTKEKRRAYISHCLWEMRKMFTLQ